MGAVEVDRSTSTNRGRIRYGGRLATIDGAHTMRLPQFTAERALYKTSRTYRAVSHYGRADGGAGPALSYHKHGASLFDLIHRGPHIIDYLDVRACCRDCLRFPCADESCRRQRAHYCTTKCNAAGIGGCECPPGRTVCEGACCRPGEACSLDGCAYPNEICHQRRCLGHCLPSGCCPPHRIVCNNQCCAFGVKVCARDGNCVSCGYEGDAPCEGMTCKGDLHPNIDMLTGRLVCTASCGHVHQNACRTQYQVPGGVRSRYRCFKHSKLFATGPADPSNCVCVANTTDRENDVSDNSGFCISMLPAPGDIADPPDCKVDEKTGRC
jgi:hypothetical protein